MPPISKDLGKLLDVVLIGHADCGDNASYGKSLYYTSQNGDLTAVYIQFGWFNPHFVYVYVYIYIHMFGVSSSVWHCFNLACWGSNAADHWRFSNLREFGMSLWRRNTSRGGRSQLPPVAVTVVPWISLVLCHGQKNLEMAVAQKCSRFLSEKILKSSNIPIEWW